MIRKEYKRPSVKVLTIGYESLMAASDPNITGDEIYEEAADKNIETLSKQQSHSIWED